MKKIVNKFRYGLMAGAIVLVLPLAANSAPWNCPSEHNSLRQPGVLAMQNIQNEMSMNMRRGRLAPPADAMMQPPPLSFGENPLPLFLLGLDLTEPQQDKIFELLHSQEPTMRAQHKAVHKAMEEIHLLAASDHFNPSEIHPLADKLAKAIADTLVLKTTTETRILALLTPEQRKQANEMCPRFGTIPKHDKIPSP
ncbi:MAG: Spy/CpxP family protein refolding chaperone [Gallionellaceae bacterium]|jgi:Spy/CpxP family protein refolding chaperone